MHTLQATSDGASSDPRAGGIKKIAFASLIGTTIEWYDFFIYGTAAALVFGKLFFPNVSQLAGTLASFATFAVAYFARPVGGVVFGHFGDRVGRKNTLVITLLLMGTATFAIGVLPTYRTIGVGAPILLVILRFAQGFAVGGEWGGAVLMSVEHAPGHRRGLYGSWPQLGVPIGLILSSGLFYFIARLPEDDLLSWGWRLPFLGSIVLVVVGLVLRLSLEETPAARQLKRELEAEAAAEPAVPAVARVARLPIIEVLRRYYKQIGLIIGSMLALNISFHVVSVFTLSYATKQLGVASDTMLLGVVIAAALDIPAQLWFGSLSDRIGRRRVFLFGAGFVGAFAFPYFALVNTGQPVLVILAMTLTLVLGHAVCYSVLAAIMSESFNARIRYSGVSFAYQFGNLITAPVPLIATSLFAWRHQSWPIAVFMLAAAVVSLIAMSFIRETGHQPLTDEQSAATEQALPALRVDPAATIRAVTPASPDSITSKGSR